MRNTGFQFPSKRINDNNAAVDRSAMTGGGKMKVERAVTSCLQVVWRDVGRPARIEADSDFGRSSPLVLQARIMINKCCMATDRIAKFRNHLAIAQRHGKATKGAATTLSLKRECERRRQANKVTGPSESRQDILKRKRRIGRLTSSESGGRYDILPEQRNLLSVVLLHC